MKFADVLFANENVSQIYSFRTFLIATLNTRKEYILKQIGEAVIAGDDYQEKADTLKERIVKIDITKRAVDNFDYEEIYNIDLETFFTPIAEDNRDLGLLVALAKDRIISIYHKKK